MLSIDQASQRERAAVAALGALPKELRRALRDETRDRVVPLAKRAVAAAADDDVMRRIAASGRYSQWRDIPGVAFGGTRAVTSTGTPGRALVRGLEFGSNGRERALYYATIKGKRTSVRRASTRQFMPDRPSGSAVTPGLESITDDVLDLWVDLVEEKVVDAFNGES